MFCSNCGNQIVEGAKFCGVCGAPAAEVTQQTNVQDQQNTQTAPVSEPVYEQTFYYERPETEDPFVSEEKNSAAKSALVWGILSLAFGLYTGLLGIIFACVGFSKANKYKNLNNGILDGKAKVGRGLSIGGLCAGIVVVALFVLFFALGVAMGLSGEVSPDYYFDDDLYQLSLSAMNKML